MSTNPKASVPENATSKAEMLPTVIKNYFRKKKRAYSQHIIDYPGSPDGKAYIGTAKKPLMPSRGLVSDETSLQLTKNCLKAKENIARFARDRQAGKFGTGGKYKGASIEQRNKTATCPAQLKERLYEFIRANRELPSTHNRGAQIYRSLKRRYPSWGLALKDHGLPMLCRKGTNMKYTFPDGTEYEYNINRFPDREKLFHMLMKKCPVLSPKA